MTNGVPEEEKVVQLLHSLISNSVQEGFATIGSNGVATFNKAYQIYLSDHGMAESIRETSQKAWQDSRYAGQLLFHNTGNLGDIARGGYIVKSRMQQLKDTGSFRAQTEVNMSLGNNMHSNVPHWSEVYDPIGYKLGTDQQPGTIAVPLAEMIVSAPFARNSEYGVVQLKSDHAEAIQNVPINDKIGNIGAGGFDRQGAAGGDRVFFADNRSDHAVAAVTYSIDAGKGMGGPDGNASYQLVTSAEQRIFDVGYGTGENMPGLVYVEYDIHNRDNNGRVGGFTQEDFDKKTQAEQSTAVQIRHLQEESRHRDKYRDKFVVPLRSGVMEFIDEGNMVADGDIFMKYRQDITHSAITATDEEAVRALKN